MAEFVQGLLPLGAPAVAANEPTDALFRDAYRRQASGNDVAEAKVAIPTRIRRLPLNSTPNAFAVNKIAEHYTNWADTPPVSKIIQSPPPLVPEKIVPRHACGPVRNVNAGRT